MSGSAKRPKSRANEIIWKGSPTIRSFIGYYVKHLFWATLVVVILYLLTKPGVLATWHVVLIAIVIYSVVIGYGHLKRTMTRYTLTRSRVLLQEGVLNIRKEQALLTKINNVIVERDLIDRLLQIGTIEIETANDSHGTSLRLYGLAEPQKVEMILDELRNAIDEENYSGGPSADDLDLSFLDD